MEYTQTTLPVATAEEAQALLDQAASWHLRHAHTVSDSHVEETPEGFVGVLTYQMEGERVQIAIGEDRTVGEREQLGPGEPGIPEKKSGWPWYTYLGIGLGAASVITVAVLIIKRSK